MSSYHGVVAAVIFFRDDLCLLKTTRIKSLADRDLLLRPLFILNIICIVSLYTLYKTIDFKR